MNVKYCDRCKEQIVFDKEPPISWTVGDIILRPTFYSTKGFPLDICNKDAKDLLLKAAALK